ncbi:MAG: O-antigen ligase family protein, partial [Gaiellaceae bacterium]|nr:O-antigen ligase family protein [Gaiellaceae bacterium]
MAVLTRRRRSVLVALAVAAIVAAANASQGAYFSQSWGWVALAFLVPTTVALILGVEAPGRRRGLFAILVVALGAWIALSALWSLSPAASIRETERMLVYVSLALAVALLLRRGDAPAIPLGALVGIVAIAGYALATKLFQGVAPEEDPDAPVRLAGPVGYWNALGLLASCGILLALGICSHGRRSSLVAAAAATLPTLACTLYFTFSRGAWVALAAGLLAMLALDARRLRVLVTAVPACVAPAAAIALASQRSALTSEGAALADAVAEGRDLALWIVVLSGGSALLALSARSVSRAVPVGRSLRRAVDLALGLSLVVSVAALVASQGGPVSLAAELRERARSGLAMEDPSNVQERLFSLSATGRLEHLEVAWKAALESPIVGNGAGTYEISWYELRPVAFDVRDAHSLYAEALAEVGVIGLALLLVALVLPALAALSARRSPFVPAAFGAYVAWAAHSALDWDWEVVGVTATALLSGGACLLAAERHRGSPLSDAVRRPI